MASRIASNTSKRSSDDAAAPQPLAVPVILWSDTNRLALGLVAAVCLLALLPAMALANPTKTGWQQIKHKFIGGPYAGAGGMAAGGGSVGVEDFADDSEAIAAIRLFPGVMRSFGGLAPDAPDAQVAEKFLPALKVMLPHGGYFHDTLYNIQVLDDNTITCTTGDMQLTAPRQDGQWGVPKAGMPVFTTMRVLPSKVEMDLHGVEKWAWRTCS